MNKLNEKRTVQVEFMDDTEAMEFKKEMEERYGVNRASRYALPKGTGKRGTVFVESKLFNKILSQRKIEEARMEYSGSGDLNPDDIFNIASECLENFNFSKTTSQDPAPMTYRIQRAQNDDELSASVEGNYYDDIIVECSFSSHTGYSYTIITQSTDEQVTWAGYTKNELREDIADAVKVYMQAAKSHAGKKTFEIYLEETFKNRDEVVEFLDKAVAIFGCDLYDKLKKYMTKEEFSSTFAKINDAIKNGTGKFVESKSFGKTFDNKKLKEGSNYGHGRNDVYHLNDFYEYKHDCKNPGRCTTGDIVVTSDGDEFMVGRKIKSKFEKTMDNGARQMIFGKDKERFATDDPTAFIETEYDTFLETEKISLWFGNEE